MNNVFKLLLMYMCIDTQRAGKYIIYHAYLQEPTFMSLESNKARLSQPEMLHY